MIAMRGRWVDGVCMSRCDKPVFNIMRPVTKMKLQDWGPSLFTFNMFLKSFYWTCLG